jgi:hypothetical protein
MHTPLSRQVLAASWRSWVSSDLQRVGPAWLQPVWTAVFAAGIAVLFTVFGWIAVGRDNGLGTPSMWATWYGKNLVVCLVVSYVIHAMFELSRRMLGRARLRAFTNVQRTLYFAGIPLLGCVIGWPIGVALAGGDVLRWFQSEGGRQLIVSSLVTALVLTFLFHLWFGAKARELDAERRATEAQLRLLQAQIEPHFLFNTLANVAALIEHEPAKARSMLEAFGEYLRGSLATLRHEEAPLASELELAEAYLRVLSARMEERLSFSIDADERARRVNLPPLLLQPLVENAVVHGLEPRVEGGHVRLAARVQGRELVVEVEDDGLGLAAARAGGAPAPAAGHGVALVNIRERLRSRFGDEARLELGAAGARGTRARLTIPLDAVPA